MPAYPVSLIDRVHERADARDLRLSELVDLVGRHARRRLTADEEPIRGLAVRRRAPADGGTCRRCVLLREKRGEGPLGGQDAVTHDREGPVAIIGLHRRRDAGGHPREREQQRALFGLRVRLPAGDLEHAIDDDGRLRQPGLDAAPQVADARAVVSRQCTHPRQPGVCIVTRGDGRGTSEVVAERVEAVVVLERDAVEVEPDLLDRLRDGP